VAIRFSEDEVSRFRVRRQHLACRAPVDACVQVVHDVCGLQAQNRSFAGLALAARVQNLSEDDVEGLLQADHGLLRTWLMRGTAHVVAADDLSMYIGALSADNIREVQRWLSHKGLQPDQLEEIANRIEKALAAGPLTRKELADELARRFGNTIRPWIDHGWGGIVKLAALQGRVCFGPSRGAVTTFMRVDRKLPGFAPESEASAQDQLFKAYLRGYGPAEVRDFAYWSGLRMEAARETAERLSEELTEVTVDARPALSLSEDLEELSREAEGDSSVRLLPSFDPYLLGARDKQHLVDRRNYKTVFRKAGWISPVVLVGGRVRGVWESKRQGKRMTVRVTPFEKLGRRICSGIAAEAEELGRFMGVKTTVEFGDTQ
jgi:uncharacterized protein YcaQ